MSKTEVVTYGEAPLPNLRKLLTPSIVTHIYSLPTDDAVLSFISQDLFNFGEYAFRGDLRAEIYAKFYSNLVKYVYDEFVK
jgi:hypothetical protein